MKTEVFCTLQVEGLHNWPDCPFDEVDYLRAPHRHMFHIKAYKEVFHDDRDVEFIMMKRQIEEYLLERYDEIKVGRETYYTSKAICYFGAMSCEMIARELIEQFDLTRCEVSEDNENGAILTVE